MDSDIVERLTTAFKQYGGKQEALSLLSSVTDPSIIKGIRTSGYKRSLLHTAAHWGWSDVCEVLVSKYNCDPSYIDSERETVLHYACVNNNLATVQYLTSSLFLDPLQKNEYGVTPLERSGGKAKEYLQTLVDNAKRQGFENVVDYLKYCKGTVPSSSTTLSSGSTAPAKVPAASTLSLGPTPQLDDVFRLLKSKSNEWQNIGRGLKVDYGYRDGLVKQGVSSTNDDKLEGVLHKWIESRCSDVSWDNLVQILIELEFMDIVQDIRSCLQNAAK